MFSAQPGHRQVSNLAFALTSGQLLGFLLVGTSGHGTCGLGRGFLARRALDLLPFQLIFYVLGIGHYFPCLHFFQLSKLFHQLLHAEFCKLYRNLRVITVSLAAEDNALSIFGMTNTLAAAESCCSRNGDLHLWPAHVSLSRREELGDVIQGTGPR